MTSSSIARQLPTSDDTRRLGRELGALLRAGDLVVLTGSLGAGKTVFVQGVGAGLGVRGPVVSPTFVIARVHRDGRVPLVHVDAYRLRSLAEVDDLDLDVELTDSVLAVEWGAGLVEQLTDSRVEVQLTHGRRWRAALRRARPVRCRLGRSIAEIRLTAVYVLAIDTSSAAVTAAVAALSPGGIEILAQRVTIDARAHAEVLTPSIEACLREAGRTVRDLAAVVAGVGPGPFTGLRVGLVTAAVLGDTLGIPTYGAGSLDAISVRLTPDPLLVAGDARRQEIYWARYADNSRQVGPDVGRPESIDTSGLAVMAGAGARRYADVLGLPLLDRDYPTVDRTGHARRGADPAGCGLRGAHAALPAPSGRR